MDDTGFSGMLGTTTVTLHYTFCSDFRLTSPKCSSISSGWISPRKLCGCSVPPPHSLHHLCAAATASLYTQMQCVLPWLKPLVASQPLWDKIHSTLSLCDLVPVRSGPQSATLWPRCPSFCPSSSFWPQPFTLTASFPWTTGLQTFARLTAPALRTFSIPSHPTPALPPAYPSPFSLGLPASFSTQLRYPLGCLPSASPAPSMA